MIRFIETSEDDALWPFRVFKVRPMLAMPVGECLYVVGPGLVVSATGCMSEPYMTDIICELRDRGVEVEVRELPCE